MPFYSPGSRKGGKHKDGSFWIQPTLILLERQFLGKRGVSWWAWWERNEWEEQVRTQGTVSIGHTTVAGREGSQACPRERNTTLAASSWKVTTENLEAAVTENKSIGWHLLLPGTPGTSVHYAGRQWEKHTVWTGWTCQPAYLSGQDAWHRLCG